MRKTQSYPGNPLSSATERTLYTIKDGVRVPDSELDGRTAKAVAALRFLSDEVPLLSSVEQRQQILKEIGEDVEAKLQQTPTTLAPISTLDVVEKFLASKKAINLAEASLKTYTQDYKPFIRKFPSLPPAPEEIEDYLQQFPPASKRQQYNRLNALYRFAHKRYDLPNPMLDIEKPRLKGKPQRVLFPEDAKRVEANLKDAVERGIFYLGYGMGWRSGEIRRATLGDIGTDTMTVHGKERDETVSLIPEIRDCLLPLCDGQKPDSPLIRGQRGALTKNGIWEKVKKMLGRVGIDGSPHSLRHGYGTALAMQGCDAHSIMRLMRHKDISQAIIYIHLTDRHLAKTQQAYCPLGIAQTADKNRV